MWLVIFPLWNNDSIFFLICLPLVPNKKNLTLAYLLTKPWQSAFRFLTVSLLSRVITWVFLQREAIRPLRVQIKGQYGTAAPLILAQGLRGLQQSAATLTDSFYLIGFDIKNDHKQHSQKVIHKEGTQQLLFTKVPFLYLFSVPLFSNSDEIWWNLYFMFWYGVQLAVTFP